MDRVQHSDQQKFLHVPKWRTEQPVCFQFLCSENVGVIMNQLLKAVRTIRLDPHPAICFETVFSKWQVLISPAIFFPLNDSKMQSCANDLQNLV